jgi:SulP family sulfate permease
MKPKILSTLPGYTRAAFLADALAGITVAMVALPLSLAIAIASGAPPATGLVTAIVGGFLISALGGSRVQIGGPTGAFIVVVHGVIAAHGLDGLVLATVMAGAMLLVAALLRAGRLMELVPGPVIDGFTIGIGIVIGASQLKDALGLQVGVLPAELVPKLAALWAARGTWSPAAAGLALVALILIVAARRAAPKLPGLALVLALVSAGAAWLSLPVYTIADRFGTLPSALPAPALPDMPAGRLLALLPSALLIAFLAGIESLLSATVADRMIGGSYRPNAELLAQGAANLGAALFGGLPATGAIARTATNVRAGARTPVAGMVHALVILLAMLLAAPLAGALVLPGLAALLLLTAWNMMEVDRWPQLWCASWQDRLLLLMTLALTVLVDLAVAIAAGVAAAWLLARLSGPGGDRRLPDR